MLLAVQTVAKFLLATDYTDEHRLQVACAVFHLQVPRPARENISADDSRVFTLRLQLLRLPLWLSCICNVRSFRRIHNP